MSEKTWFDLVNEPHDMPSQPVMAYPQKPKKMKSRWLKILPALGILVLAGGLGFAFLRGDKQTEIKEIAETSVPSSASTSSSVMTPSWIHAMIGTDCSSPSATPSDELQFLEKAESVILSGQNPRDLLAVGSPLEFRDWSNPPAPYGAAGLAWCLAVGEPDGLDFPTMLILTHDDKQTTWTQNIRLTETADGLRLFDITPIIDLKEGTK